MKKFLLSASLLGAGVAAASAQSFDFYISNTLEEGTNEDGMKLLKPVDYQKVSDGDVVEIKNLYKTFEDDPAYYYVQAELMAYTRIVNLTDPKEGHDITMTISYAEEGTQEDNTAQLGDVHAGFMTCVGGSCTGNNPFSFTINKGGETASVVGEHIGYEVSSETQGLVDQLTLNAKYNVTATADGQTLHFTLFFNRTGSAAVDSIEAADAPAVYYNMQGIRVDNPEAGQIYIMRKGDKVSKVIR